jgi:hypothetical protein
LSRAKLLEKEQFIRQKEQDYVNEMNRIMMMLQQMELKYHNAKIEENKYLSELEQFPELQKKLQAQKEAFEILSQQLECKICYENKIEVAFVACGHMCICRVSLLNCD